MSDEKSDIDFEARLIRIREMIEAEGRGLLLSRWRALLEDVMAECGSMLTAAREDEAPATAVESYRPASAQR